MFNSKVVIRRSSTKTTEKSQERPHSQPVLVEAGRLSSPSGVASSGSKRLSEPSARPQGSARASTLSEGTTPTKEAAMATTPTSSGSKIKSRSRSKSPFRSFRWRSKKQAAAEGSHSDDDTSEGQSPGTDDDVFEGTLVRKHEWESTTKRATTRSWDKVYCVAKENKMWFYKDSKTYKSTPDQTFRGEPPLDLAGSTAEVASDYTKKKHVFRIKLSSGGEFLLQATDDAGVSSWLGALGGQAAAAGGSSSRAHTLPPPQREDQKRRSFFTLKKN